MIYLDKNIDFVNLKNIFINDDEDNEIAIISEEWPLEVIGNYLGCNLGDIVKNPEKWTGASSRLLILMQWANIIHVLTSGGNEDCYFDAEDFFRVKQCFIKKQRFENKRLTIDSLNKHFEWIEKKYKKKFIDDKEYCGLCEKLDLGRLKSEIVTTIE